MGETLAKTKVPWEIRPYSLVNWWDMAKFQGHQFCMICSHLSLVSTEWKKNPETILSADKRKSSIGNLEFIRDKCESAGLKNIAQYITDNLPLLDYGGVGYQQFLDHFGNLDSMLQSEMKSIEFLVVDNQKYYGDTPLFDSFVTDIYPELTYDIVEAGNCLALGRPTASVFHLMKIMEFGVQRFGKKLEVPLVNEIVWQVILDQTNSRIKLLPEKPRSAKLKKEAYADLAAHLYNVKVAWRNPVMHPKRTYTPEEAERLFDTVKTFMGVLVKLLRPKTVARLSQQSIFQSDTEAMKSVFEAMRLGK